MAAQGLSQLSGPALDAGERRVKQRTLGNVRLIAELFNKEVVREPILHVCIAQLLGEQGKDPNEDNVEVRATLRPCAKSSTSGITDVSVT